MRDRRRTMVWMTGVGAILGLLALVVALLGDRARQGVRPLAVTATDGIGDAPSRSCAVGSADTNPGLVADPRDPNTHGDILRYLDGLCLGDVNTLWEEYVRRDTTEAEQRSFGDRAVIIRPERRMYRTDLTRPRPGQGWIVGSVYVRTNRPWRAPRWPANSQLAGRQEGYIWYGYGRAGAPGDSGRYASLFVVRGRGANRQIAVIPVEGRWTLPHPNDSPWGVPAARWTHPTLLRPPLGRAPAAAVPVASFVAWQPQGVPAGGAAAEAGFVEGGGWISCLRGCCPMHGLFAEE